MPITISDLSKLHPHRIAMGQTYVLRIAIKSLAPRQVWWYQACDRCHKKVNYDGESYICSACDGIANSPRYRLPLLAQDPSNINDEGAPVSEFTFFGDLAEQLIAYPAAALAGDTSHVQDSVPSQITTLYGKHYDVIAAIEKGSLQKQYKACRIKSFTPALVPLTDSSAHAQSIANMLEAQPHVGADNKNKGKDIDNTGQSISADPDCTSKQTKKYLLTGTSSERHTTMPPATSFIFAYQDGPNNVPSAR